MTWFRNWKMFIYIYTYWLAIYLSSNKIYIIYQVCFWIFIAQLIQKDLFMYTITLKDCNNPFNSPSQVSFKISFIIHGKTNYLHCLENGDIPCITKKPEWLPLKSWSYPQGQRFHQLPHFRNQSEVPKEFCPTLYNLS